MAGFGDDGLAEFGDDDGEVERREWSQHERRGAHVLECTAAAVASER
jgi:hypothetical protein